MRKTLININTMVRDILHELGFSRVRKQVESRELHVLCATVTDDILANFNGRTDVLEVRTTVGNADDREGKILPFVTIGSTVVTTYNGKFCHEKRSSYEWKQFAFTNKEKLKKDFKKYLEDHQLMCFCLRKK